MTRKHYEKIAKILRDHNATVAMTMDLMDFFKEDNPNFDKDKFAKMALSYEDRKVIGVYP